MTESTLAPESKPLDRSPEGDGPASEGTHDTSDKVTENGDSQSVEEEVLDDEDMDAEDSGSQKADEKSIAEGDGKKRLIRETPCGNDCTNGCNAKFPEDLRVKIYDIYWGFQGGSEEQQKWMEKYCIEKAIPKISAKSMGSTRNRSFVYLYFLPQLDQNMQKIRVCKKFLAATLGITERILSGFVYRFVGNGGLDVEDTEWSPMAGYENCSREQMFLLREFIQGLPAEPVHYCRNEQCTRKLYELPSSIPDVSTLYGMYSSSEESLHREPVDEGVFRNVLYQDYNLSFCTATRGDICSVREYRKSGKK